MGTRRLDREPRFGSTLPAKTLEALPFSAFDHQPRRGTRALGLEVKLGCDGSCINCLEAKSTKGTQFVQFSTGISPTISDGFRITK